MEVKGNRYYVPCGKCNFCLQNKRNEWAYRLSYHLKRAETADFITLTYDGEHIPLMYDDRTRAEYMILEKEELKQFFKSLKQNQDRQLERIGRTRTEVRELKKKWKIKYYAVGEYGTRYQRPHYHAVIYNLHRITLRKLARKEIWPKGEIHRGDVNDMSIQYTAKYIIDGQREEWSQDPRPKPFMICSKGLGKEYIAKRGKWHTTAGRLYVMNNGHKVRMPRYYKDKIFTEEERKTLGAIAAEEQEAYEYSKLQEVIQEMGDEIRGHEMYQEQLRTKHNQIKLKSKRSNRF